jgi:hypothetical protein
MKNLSILYQNAKTPIIAEKARTIFHRRMLRSTYILMEIQTQSNFQQLQSLSKLLGRITITTGTTEPNSSLLYKKIIQRINLRNA